MNDLLPAPPALPRRTPYPTVLGSVVILAVAGFFYHGLPALNRLVPDARPLAADARQRVGHGVSFAPAPGWQLQLSGTKPGETSALIRETATFTLTTFDWTGTEDELQERVRRLFEGAHRFHVYGEKTPFRTTNGQAGVRFAIHGDRVEGRVWLLLLPGRDAAIAARLKSTAAQFPAALDEAEAMIAGLWVEAAP